MSPNGDGINDVLKMPGMEKYPDNVLQIFDTNGEIVYQETGYGLEGKVFDGYPKGIGVRNRNQIVSQGTYFYSVKYRDTNEQPYKEVSGYIYIK